MFCKKCGSELDEGSLFCNKCGTPVNDNASGNQDAKPSASVLNTDSIALSKKNLLLIGMGAILLLSVLSGVFKLYVYEGSWSDEGLSLWDIGKELMGSTNTGRNVAVLLGLAGWVGGIWFTIDYFGNFIKEKKDPKKFSTDAIIAGVCQAASVFITGTASSYLHVGALGWIIIVASLLNATVLALMYNDTIKKDIKPFADDKKIKVCPHCKADVPFGSKCPKCGKFLY